jgi:hypothetical protein
MSRQTDRAERRRQRVKMGDALAAWVQGHCKRISAAEAMTALGNAGVVHKVVEHGDCCLQRITGSADTCTCTPTVSFYKRQVLS